MRINIILTLILLVALAGCEKNSPDAKEVQVYGITSKKAVIDWSGVFEDEQQQLFQVYLGDSLYAELEQVFFYEIKKLAQNTRYTGQVTATREDDGKQVVSPFSFVTKMNEPPHEFEARVTRITGESVSLQWEKPFDPDGDTLTYAVIVNGVNTVDSLPETACSIHGLLPLTHNKIEVWAHDGHGNSIPCTVTFRTPAAGGTLALVQEKFEGISREYGLYLPSGTGSAKLPLNIHLHGWGGVVWPGMISDYAVTLAENEQFISLMPQALADHHGNIAWRDPVDLAFIGQLIDTLTVRHQVDPERVYLSGHSNGAFMTYILGRVLEAKLAAIGPIAGTMTYPNYYSYSLLKPMPLCHIHGTADSTVQVQGNATHVSFVKVLEFFLSNNNASPTPTIVQLPDTYPYDNSTVTKITYPNLGNSSGDIVYYRINNGSHAIPGTNSWANKDIHAWDVLWAFFKTRKLSDK